MINKNELVNKYNLLTKKQREVFDYMMDNPKDIQYITLKDLAKRAGSSEVTILKVCKQLGFENFVGLKKAFQNSEKRLLSFNEIENLVNQSSSRSQEQKKELFKMICMYEQENITDMINGIDVDLIFKCAQQLLEANEIIVFGHNASKTLADYLTHRLSYLRLKAYSVKLGDDHIVKTALARMDNKDFVVLFSFPPYHYPTADIVKFAQMKGAGIITITYDMTSPAIADNGHTFICKTKSPFFYNVLSVPMKFIELLASSMAIQLGEQFDKIVNEEVFIGKFINENI